ncbi:MAG TPA: STAS domain-containing protein [Micromonosporaceae bacterium]|nr:STAS domain-containing protein [Micromonosporaceae bacterium]
MHHNRVIVRRHDDCQILAVVGEIDHARAASLEAEMLAAAEPGTPLIVDLTGVTFLDSAGLRLLDDLVRTCAERRSPVRIVAPRPGAVRFTIDLIGFRPELLAETADEATAALTG